MIVKMQKYSFLVYHKAYIDFLKNIREIGVLHIVERTDGTPEDENLLQKMQYKAQLNKLIKDLRKRAKGEKLQTARTA